MRFVSHILEDYPRHYVHKEINIWMNFSISDVSGSHFSLLDAMKWTNISERYFRVHISDDDTLMIMRLNWQYNVIKSSSNEKREDNDHAYVYNRRGSPFSKHLNISIE